MGTRALSGALLCALLVSATAVHADASPRRILVFGDSLTWGWVPSSPIVADVRHPPEARWTTALENALGPGHVLIVDGLSGRTTNVPDARDPTLDGSAALPATLAANAPLDLVILLLGTNDTRAEHGRSAFEIGLGAIRLIDIVRRSEAGDTLADDGPGPDILLISPPPLAGTIDPGAADDFAGAREKSLWLPTVYAAIADAAGAGFLDAGSVIRTDGADGIHLTAAANGTLGRAVAESVRAHPSGTRLLD